MSLPPRFDTDVVERECGRWLGLNPDGSHKTCKKPAVIHIAWEWVGEREVDNGYACEEHRHEAITRWSPAQHHALGACCGMPGARWYPQENICRYEEEGLPLVVTERKEVVAWQ